MSTLRVPSSLVCLLALAGCPEPKADSTPPIHEDGQLAASETTAYESAPGVYFAVEDRIVRLSPQGAFSTLASPGPARALQLGPQGRVLALVGDALLVDEGEAGFVARERFDPSLGAVERLAFGEGGPWALGHQAIGHAEGGTWKRIAALGAEVDAFASAPRAATYLLIDDRVVRFDGPEARVEVATLPFGHAKQLALGEGEGLAIAGHTCELALVDPGGGGWQRAREPNYGCEYPTALGLDERARVWVASTTGVHVLAEGELVHAWPSGSRLELLGEVHSIVVVGESPAELPQADAVRTGGIAGTLEYKGKPAAKAKVEICPRPAPIFHDSPCGHSLLRATTTTDAKGHFALEGVPLARYGWALQIGDRWTMQDASSMPGSMREGEVLELGVQRLE